MCFTVGMGISSCHWGDWIEGVCVVPQGVAITTISSGVFNQGCEC